MNISELFKDAKDIKDLVSERLRRIDEFKKRLIEITNEEKENEEEKLNDIQELERDISIEKKQLEKNKEKLAKIFDELMKYREVRAIFEKQVKNEIQERLDAYSAVNNVYKDIIKDKRDELKAKYEDIDININYIKDIKSNYDDFFKDEENIKKDLQDGKLDNHKDLCEYLDQNVSDEIGGYLEKYEYLKNEYNEQINLYNYETYNKMINPKTKDRYTNEEREKGLEEFNLTIDNLLESQMPEIENIAQSLDDNINLKKGIEEHFNVYKIDSKALSSKNDLSSKIDIIKNLVYAYSINEVRQDMGKREDILKRAVKNVEEKIIKLQKEYKETGAIDKEESDIKKEDKNAEKNKGKNINIEANEPKKTYTIKISQDELNKIIENRKKQNEEKEVDEAKDQEIKKEEEKENRAKTFLNSIKERFIKRFSEKEEDIEEPDVEEKEKEKEDQETETDNKQKEEELKEFNKNDQSNFDNHIEDYEKEFAELFKDEIEKATDEEIEKLTNSPDKEKDEKEKEQDDKDERER